MNGQYTSLARCYDKLNAADSARTAATLDGLLRRWSEKRPETVLDLACGTGAITAELAKLGYSVSGVDLSEDMLTAARVRFDSAGSEILLTRQDMRDFSLLAPVDAVVCCFDSVNYLLTTEDVAACFAKVRAALVPGGTFIFDVNTVRKFETFYAGRDFVSEAEDGTLCAWRNEYNPRTRICRFYLSVFEQDAGTGLYVRSDELQRERAYTERTLDRLLGEAGFEVAEKLGEDGAPPKADDLRRIYVCRGTKK